MRNCLAGSAPYYLKAYCVTVSSLPSRSSLLASMVQSRSFAIVLENLEPAASASCRRADFSISFEQITSTRKPPSLSVNALAQVWNTLFRAVLCKHYTMITICWECKEKDKKLLSFIIILLFILLLYKRSLKNGC